MSLTVKLKNIGIIKQAEFSLGDLTIICGENNTGKTYVAYSLYGFLKYQRDSRESIRFPVSDAHIQRLLTEGELKFDLAQYVKNIDQVLAESCKIYTEQLEKVFAASEGVFCNSEFHLQTGTADILNTEIKGERWSIAERYRVHMPFINYLKRYGSEELTITLGAEKWEEKIDFDFAKSVIGSIISNIIFSDTFPRPFIFSSERTGVSIFRKELDYARSHLLDEVILIDKKTGTHQLSSKTYQSYPLPITENIDFSRRLDDFAKNKSFISKEHPEILADFTDIVGGEYAITQHDQLYYIPKDTQTKLTMVESSSTVRSLLDLSFYLRCIAKKGDVLMIDEPELNLHPENQRRIARLFARLVNLGVKVFITTHSDYIIKELNTLIMLNHDKPHMKRIVEENGYQESELIKAEQVKVYVAEKALMPLEEGQKRRKKGHTLVPAKIHPKFGIEVTSFDKTIDNMNRIQDEIVWGEEQLRE